MEPINTTGSQTLKSFQPPKVEAAPKADAPTVAVAPKFISPNGNIDAKSGTYSVQFRDTSNGDVKSEYPSKAATQEYRKPVKQEQQPQPQPQPQPKVQASDAPVQQHEGTGAGTKEPGLNLKV